MLETVLSTFETLSLDKLESSGLFQKRHDRKYVIPKTDLEALLEFCKEYYAVLSIDGCRVFEYETRYFDTPEFDMYHQHHSGRAVRKKLRERTYLDSGAKFLEIKNRTNKGFTEKHRIPISPPTEMNGFIEHYSGFSNRQLTTTLTTRYKRITLFHKSKVEKLTLDMDLVFFRDDQAVSYSNIVMIESKAPLGKEGQVLQFLKQKGIRKGSLSKYCLGLISLIKDIKYNRFKRIFTQLVNLNNHGQSGLLHQ